MNQLFTLDADGVRKDIPYYSYQRLFNPVFHPGGTHLAISQTHFDTDLLEITATGPLVQLVDSLGEDHLARYSPSGEEIAFVSSRSGKPELYLLKNQQQTLIYDNPDNQPVYRAPVCSKAGGRIFFAFGKKLFIYDIADKRLSTQLMPEYFTAVMDVFNNETHLLITSKRDNLSFFERYDLVTGESLQLIEVGINFQGRLNDKDEICYVKDNILHWGGNSIEIPEDLRPVSVVFPMGDDLLFQSGERIMAFTNSEFSNLAEFHVETGSVLIEVHSSGKMLLQTRPQSGANIVEIH